MLIKIESTKRNGIEVLSFLIQLRQNTVAGEHNPESPGHETEGPKPELITLVRVVAEPCYVELRRIRVADHVAG
jgi:hypothetical protein